MDEIKDLLKKMKNVQEKNAKILKMVLIAEENVKNGKEISDVDSDGDSGEKERLHFTGTSG